MNKALSTFLGLALTALAISAFLFIFGFNMIGDETKTYSEKTSAVQSHLPSGTTTTNGK